MAWWKQLVISLAVVIAALLVWMIWVPSAMPLLERAGVLQQIDRLGLSGPLARIGVTIESEQGGAGGPPGGGPPGAGGPPSAGGPPGAGGPPFGGGGSRSIPVIAQPVIEAVRKSNVSAIGTGQALRSVSITPEASGRIVEINVSPGDQVQAGTTLARLDSSAEDIALDRAELVLADARSTVERLARLQRSGATTDIQIRDAELALNQAELDYRQARLNLDRRAIVAPISGYVGFVAADIGDQVGTSTRLTGIDDRSSLLVEFLVPERHVVALSEGMELSASPLSRPGTTLQGRLRALDNRVDSASRSLRVQAEIDNPDDMLRPGMAFSITLDFSGESYPAVDPLAIQWSSNGAFVWAVRDEQVQRVPVRILQRMDNGVLVDAALAPGDLVVTEGVQSLRPGAAVDVRNAAPQAADETDDAGAEQARANGRPAPI